MFENIKCRKCYVTFAFNNKFHEHVRNQCFEKKRKLIYNFDINEKSNSKMTKSIFNSNIESNFNFTKNDFLIIISSIDFDQNLETEFKFREY